ncbi:MAG: DNA polymerase III subunit chi [Pseudomonadota bacterium]
MAEIRFYHLTRASLETALPVMLERTLAREQKAVVQLGSEARVEALANHLWTYNDSSFLPHGSSKDGNAALQPVWLTDADAPAPNGAQVLFLADGAMSERIADFDLCAILFDGRDDEAVGEARAQWKTLKSAGHQITYWQQNDRGAWEQQA